MTWFVLYTKPRSEKKVAEQLKKMGVTVYCPLVTQIHQWSDRKKKIEVPLLNSYVFVQLEAQHREMVFQVQGVVRYIFWLGRPAVVRDQEIEVMKLWLANDGIDAKVEKIQRGDHMQVPSGPFKGKEGVVEEIGKNRIQLVLLELGMKITLTKQKTA